MTSDGFEVAVKTLPREEALVAAFGLGISVVGWVAGQGKKMVSIITCLRVAFGLHEDFSFWKDDAASVDMREA